MISVIIPASNEETYIGPCLTALFHSVPTGSPVEAIVVANGCKDQTAARARDFDALAQQKGWHLTVLDLEKGSKPLALNQGDLQARGGIRVYLDADVCVSPNLMSELAVILATDKAAYASGTPEIPRAQSWVTRHYAAFWQLLPFNQTTAPGYGLFAVNAAGRARWPAFPHLISDDTFVRLQFQPGERHQCPATYLWPMIEGFGALTRVRRRQDLGVKELERLYPGLSQREGKARLTLPMLVQRAVKQPLGFCIYAAVSIAVRLGKTQQGFTRGR